MLAAGSLSYSPKRDSFASVRGIHLDLAQALDASRRLIPEAAAKSLAVLQSITGRAQGRAEVRHATIGWSARSTSGNRIPLFGIEGLARPVKLAGGSVTSRATPVEDRPRDVAMLDSRATASATIGYNNLRIEGAVSDGSVGENLLAWVMETAGAPRIWCFKTPIRIAVERAAWSPKQPLDLAATAVFDAGPT